MTDFREYTEPEAVVWWEAQEKRIADAVKVAADHGQTDGAHHKAWVIDQMLRALLGTDYDAWVSSYPDEWDTGVAP